MDLGECPEFVLVDKSPLLYLGATIYIIGSNCISIILLLVVNLQPVAKIPVPDFLLVRK